MTAHWRVPAGLHTASAQLPDEGELPSLDGASGWLNSPPLTPAGLRGKVVLVDFWTYTCINWLRQLPYLRAWAGKYSGHGLVVIGVHTPEFSFEQNAGNVRRAVQEMRIDYPVATDNDYAVWLAFGNHYWPALYFADAQGRIRHHHFGEGEYAQSEMVIQQLLAEAGSTGAGHEWSRSTPAAWKPRPTGPACGHKKITPATSAPRASRPPAARCRASRTSTPPRRSWGSTSGPCRGTGPWKSRPTTLNAAGGQIACRFRARDLNLVMGPAAPGTPVRCRVAHRRTVTRQGARNRHRRRRQRHLLEQRLYQLIRQPGPITDRTFEITFPIQALRPTASPSARPERRGSPAWKIGNRPPGATCQYIAAGQKLLTIRG